MPKRRQGLARKSHSIIALEHDADSSMFGPRWYMLHSTAELKLEHFLTAVDQNVFLLSSFNLDMTFQEDS